MKVIGLLLAALLGLVVVRRVRPPAPPVLALDVDGDGRADHVRLVPHGDALWLDVELAADGFDLASTTRVADATSAAGWSLRAVGRSGRLAILVRDRRGRVTAWGADELGFAAQAPVARSTTE